MTLALTRDDESTDTHESLRLPPTRMGLTASQIDFVDVVVNHLTEHGLMEAALLYESPFTDLTPHGPNGLFNTGQVDQLMGALASVRATAVAA